MRAERRSARSRRPGRRGLGRRVPGLVFLLPGVFVALFLLGFQSFFGQEYWGAAVVVFPVIFLGDLLGLVTLMIFLPLLGWAAGRRGWTLASWPLIFLALVPPAVLAAELGSWSWLRLHANDARHWWAGIVAAFYLSIIATVILPRSLEEERT